MNANSLNIILPSLAFLQSSYIHPMASAFAWAVTGGMANQCGMECLGTLARDGMAMVIAGGIVIN